MIIQPEVRIKEICNVSVSYCFLQLQFWGTVYVHVRERNSTGSVRSFYHRLEDNVISLRFWCCPVCMCLYVLRESVLYVCVEYIIQVPECYQMEKYVCVCVFCVIIEATVSFVIASWQCSLMPQYSPTPPPPHPTHLTPPLPLSISHNFCHYDSAWAKLTSSRVAGLLGYLGEFHCIIYVVGLGQTMKAFFGPLFTERICNDTTCNREYISSHPFLRLLQGMHEMLTM